MPQKTSTQILKDLGIRKPGPKPAPEHRYRVTLRDSMSGKLKRSYFVEAPSPQIAYDRIEKEWDERIGRKRFEVSFDVGITRVKESS